MTTDDFSATENMQDVPGQRSNPGAVLRHKKRRRLRFLTSPSILRLEQRIPIFMRELDSMQVQHEQPWYSLACQLASDAQDACSQNDPERGWQSLKAADRFMLYGLNDEQLLFKARSILNESLDTKKELSAWRQKSILKLLADIDKEEAENNPAPVNLDVNRVAEAKRLLDEHQDNIYHKLGIVKTRLSWLTLIGLTWLIAWFAITRWLHLNELIDDPGSPFAPLASTPLGFWTLIVLTGILGSLISSFTSSFEAGASKRRIPEELSTDAIIFARLTVSSLSAIAVTLLILSGMLSFGTKSYALVLSAAIISGFSDRLLMNAISSHS